jgi:hypothetical protein
MFRPLTDQKFRYTFARQTITNLSVPSGLYVYGNTVLSVDSFGEVRVAIETPVNNSNKLLKDLARDAKKAGDSFGY